MLCVRFKYFSSNCHFVALANVKFGTGTDVLLLIFAGCAACAVCVLDVLVVFDVDIIEDV